MNEHAEHTSTEHRPCARNCARPWEYSGSNLVVKKTEKKETECLDCGKYKASKQRCG